MKQQGKKPPQTLKKVDNSTLLNSAKGAAIGAAVGGLAGAALSNKKAREVFEDVLGKLTKSAIEKAVKMAQDMSPVEIIVDATEEDSKKK